MIFKKKNPSPNAHNARLNFWRDLGACGLSAFLLILAYPWFDVGFLAWVALVPLLFIIDGKKPLPAFGCGYLTGFIFFAGTLYWFIHVTLAGAIAIVAYLAIYFALFATVASRTRFNNSSLRIFWLAAVWTILEFVRDKAFSGFGWVSLGHSQYKFLWLIQSADVVGVFGISFLVVAGNVLIKEFLSILVLPGRERTRFPRSAAVGLAGILVLFFGYGVYQLHRREPLPEMKVTVVQANIPQSDKWDQQSYEAILNKYIDLTKKSLASHPDLLIWPETAFPGFLWEDPQTFARIQKFVAAHGVPLLFGVITQEHGHYYNSVMLLGADGQEILRHHKIHLVPFGEYIPLADRLPLREILPAFSDRVSIEDFSAGKTLTLFPSPAGTRAGGPKYLSVLICFEDSLAGVSRRFVAAGANLLVNITNDAWFLDTNEPMLHLQTSIFRAIENRRWLIRSANTGVSCFIDAKGRIYNYLQSPQGRKTYIAGFATARVGLGTRGTWYTRWGDVFVLGCFGFVVATGILKKIRPEC